jgi:hypothetical protein
MLRAPTKPKGSNWADACWMKSVPSCSDDAYASIKGSSGSGLRNRSLPTAAGAERESRKIR